MNVRLLLLGSLVLAGCSAKRIPGTEIEDSDENRAILSVMDQYRKALEGRDAEKIIALLDESFEDDLGTATPADDIDYHQLREQLPERLAKVDEVRIDFTVRRIQLGKDKTARAVYTYTSSYKMPGLTPRPQTDSEIKEMSFKRSKNGWKITSGI